MRIRNAVIILGVILSVWGANRCTFGAPVVTVVNSTSNELVNVWISVPGRKMVYHFGNLLPGESGTRVVHVGGESGIDLGYTTGGQSQQVRNLGYLEENGGYCASIAIGEKGYPQMVTSSGCFRIKRLV